MEEGKAHSHAMCRIKIQQVNTPTDTLIPFGAEYVQCRDCKSLFAHQSPSILQRRSVVFRLGRIKRVSRFIRARVPLASIHAYATDRFPVVHDFAAGIVNTPNTQNNSKRGRSRCRTFNTYTTYNKLADTHLTTGENKKTRRGGEGGEGELRCCLPQSLNH